jgi:amidohydrolase/N-acyl-D-amino-acid deacylase
MNTNEDLHNQFDTLVRNATVIDGSGEPPYRADVALKDGRIARIACRGELGAARAHEVLDANGQVLAPGFIDVHTHDDTVVIDQPQMLPKITQGVTTVVVGNCGISASPVTLRPGVAPPDPMNLLGDASAFRYADFAGYARAVDAAHPAVNVAALVGHTALRSNHMDRFDRAAGGHETAAMRAQLSEALDHGALGLSTGLAYANANAAPTEEVLALAEPLAEAGGLYCTHLRSEFVEILDAMDEAFRIGRHARVPVVISHLKCAGVPNYGRSGEVLAALDEARAAQPVGCDCYPYTASSSTLDLKQVTDEIDILITWSEPHPEMAGKLLAEVAAQWNASLVDAAKRLQPAGAVYHCMEVADVERILRHPSTVIGSDGLPNDPLPHPRLWGAFPRVLGHYARERQLFSLQVAVRKMTGQSADRFGLADRGYVREGHAADLVLFDPNTVADAATFSDPKQPAHGIRAVWVAGELAVHERQATGRRNGRFLPRAQGARPSSFSAGDLS